MSAFVTEAIQELACMLRDNAHMTQQVQELQQRCTELTEELRAVKAERDMLAERYHELEARVALLAAQQTERPPPSSLDHQRAELGTLDVMLAELHPERVLERAGLESRREEVRCEIYAGEIDQRGRPLADVLAGQDAAERRVPRREPRAKIFSPIPTVALDDDEPSVSDAEVPQ